ncbi:hypothetical protein QJU20_02770, partial [Pasteurella atlantica]|nr:hypothetical protein [Pasteurella atlantica]
VLTMKDGKTLPFNVANKLTPEQRAKITGETTPPTPAVVNKDALKTAITEAEAVDTTGKTDETAKALTDAIAVAKTVRDDANATQQQVDDAKVAIEDAKAALKDKSTVDKVTVDKSALEKAIKDAKALDTSKKTDKSVKALTDAIAAAEIVFAKADATQKEVDDAKARIEAAKSDLKDKPTGVTIIDLNKYNDYTNAFYYVDKSIVKYIDNDVYFSLKGGLMHTLTKVQQSVNNHEKMDLLSVLGGFQAGFSMPLENSTTRVGGFFEYDNRKFGDHRVDHFGLGTSMKTENIEAFLRYRLAKYRSKSNHNVDAYVNYRYDYQALDSFRITPSIDLYMTYSSKVTLDKDIELASRFGALTNAAVQFTYMNKPMNFEVYMKPEVGFGYNDQLLKQKLPAGYKRNELKIERGYFNYALEIGANKQLGNGVKLFINTRMQGNKTHNPDYTANVGLGYSWK